MPEFNLIDEEWIPCITFDGESRDYGIRDTLLNAHEIREICDDSPLVTVALHRLLLAILYRAYEGPTEMAGWRLIYQKGCFVTDDEVGKYLNDWSSRFNLFDDDHPFMQVARLDLNKCKKNGEVEDHSDGLMRLSREAPDKGGPLLFDHRAGGTERPAYEPKQIAKMILSAQSYSGTGVASAGSVGTHEIKPKPCKGSPCVEGLVLWIQSGNLFDSLLLNLVPRDHTPEDKPAWEDDLIVEKAMRSWVKPIRFEGPVQCLAPLSRFILLLDRKCMFFTNGVKSNGDSEDPMKAYFRENEKEAYKSLKLRADKAAWRDSHILFSIDTRVRKPPASLNHVARLATEGILATNSPPRANLVGLATNLDKALLWRHERMPVPIAIMISPNLTERLEKLISEAEAVGSKLSWGLFTSKKTIRMEPVGRIQAIADLVLDPSLALLSPGVVRTPSERSPEEAHNKAALDLSQSLDPRPAYWARLEQHFIALLHSLPKDWDAKNDDWKPDDQQIATKIWREQLMIEARRALEESIRSLGTTARVIRAVAQVGTEFHKSDLDPQPQTAKTSAKKKRGGQKK